MQSPENWLADAGSGQLSSGFRTRRTRLRLRANRKSRGRAPRLPHAERRLQGTLRGPEVGDVLRGA